MAAPCFVATIPRVGFSGAILTSGFSKGLKMEIKITTLFYSIAPMDYCASCAEIGQSAGADTWRAACEDATDNIILDTDEKRDAFRAFVQSSGGWTESEIAAWSDNELSALFLQWVSGDMREMGIDHPGDPIDWADVERCQSEGQISSNIYRGNDGEIYFYAGS